MSINKGKAPEHMSFTTPITPTPGGYLPPTSGSYGIPVGMSYPAGTMYSPSSIDTMGISMGMGMGGLFNGMTPQANFPAAAFNPFGAVSYGGQSPSPTLFSQQGFGRQMNYPSYTPERGNYGYGTPSPSTNRYYGYSPRPSGPVRRQNAEKVPYHIAQHFRRNRSQSGGTHNVVDVANIGQGVDVRTTVSFPL